MPFTSFKRVATTAALVASALASLASHAAGLDLSRYSLSLTGSFALPSTASESSAITTVSRNSLQSVSLGATVGNIGLEGISLDRRNGQFVTVKESSPQAVQIGTIDFPGGSRTMTDLFTPNLGVSDLSDVQLLGGFGGARFADNMLIYSQESQRLLEVSRSGEIISSFSFTTVSSIAEGVTIASDGTIFITDESPSSTRSRPRRYPSPRPTR
jgi:uncharacterized protein YjiK